MNIQEYDVWHECYAIVAQSQDIAMLAKLLPKRGGGGYWSGPKCPSIKKMSQDTRLYLKQYWRAIGTLTDTNSQSFNEELVAS